MKLNEVISRYEHMLDILKQKYRRLIVKAHKSNTKPSYVVNVTGDHWEMMPDEEFEKSYILLPDDDHFQWDAIRKDVPNGYSRAMDLRMKITDLVAQRLD